MKRIIKAEDRHFSDFKWLQTYWLFSFSDYHDPANMNHGSLRVFNDDVVQAQSGFTTHPHEEMEIVSIVLQGEMTHKDSMGNEMRIREHDVQRMTAGTGLLHSEMNDTDQPVAFFQIWILPDKNGLEPSYDQKSFAPRQWKNRLTLLASNSSDADAVVLNTDASIYRSNLDGGTSISYRSDAGRCQFLYVIDGNLTAGVIELNKRDQLRISEESEIMVNALSACDFILIDVPHI